MLLSFIKLIIVWVLFFASFYAMGGFYEGNFDFSLWTKDTKTNIIFTEICVMGLSLYVWLSYKSKSTSSNKDEKEEN